MTADDFREIALSFPNAEERSHMNHPDFRVGNKIFATLGYPDADHGMAALTPSQQQDFLRMEPASKPAAGKWGEGGATVVKLTEADEGAVRDALNLAWQNAAAKTKR